MATLTIRLIRSLEYRNIKNIVLRDVDLEHTTTEQLLEAVLQKIQTDSALIPHRTKKYDSLKIHHHAHQHKTNNLVINLNDEEYPILKAGKTLQEQTVENETEISCFVMEEYVKYKQNPEVKW